MKRTFFSFSFGCRVNQAEKEELDSRLIKAGFSFSQVNPAVYIINTCAVTAKAEREARQLIYQVRKNYPGTKLVVTGCSATYWQKTSVDRNLPYDLLVNNTDKEYLTSLIQRRFFSGVKTVDTFSNGTEYADKFIDSGRVMIKVQDGCHRFCTFCIVPYLRGLPKSKKIDSLLTKVRSIKGNVQEIIYTAINTEAFGKDTDESLIDLIDRTLEESVVPRISFGSIHPWSLTDAFIKYYKRILPMQRFVDFFHIPLQSGSDKVLNLMKRGYRSVEILEKLNKLRKINPDALIGTDIIVGFLEETEKDFNDTYNFLQVSPINKFHVFRYSARQNTASFYLGKRLTEPQSKIKAARSKSLIRLGEKKYSDFINSQINKIGKALFLQRRPDNSFQEALLQNQLPALIKTPHNLSGEIKNVKVTGIKNNRLVGIVV